MKAIRVGKAKWKLLKLLLPTVLSLHQVNQSEAYSMPGGILEIGSIMEDLKDIVVMVTITSSFILPVYFLKNLDRL